MPLASYLPVSTQSSPILHQPYGLTAPSAQPMRNSRSDDGHSLMQQRAPVSTGNSLSPAPLRQAPQWVSKKAAMEQAAQAFPRSGATDGSPESKRLKNDLMDCKNQYYHSMQKKPRSS